MTPLLEDTLRFLQDNFDAETSWTVSPSQMHLKREKKIQVAKAPIAPPKTASIPLERPQPPPPQEEPPKTPYLEKETPKPLAAQNPPLGVESLSEAIKHLFPQFTTHKETPKEKDLRVDPAYKKVLQADVVLFSFREGKESDLFLQNIGFAISAHFTPAAVFDVKKWELSEGNFDLFFKQIQAKLLIASETLYKKSSLLPFLKEIPSASERFLGPSKLVLLHPFETYFNNPLQKKELWNTLCATLKKSLPSQVSS